MNIQPLNRAQSRRLDQLAVERYGMHGLVLMENAGRGVADLLVHLGIPGTVVVCCGKGNNAGDGFVLARHVDLRGYPVRVLVWSEAEELTGDAATNYGVLAKTDVKIEHFGDEHDAARLAGLLDGAAWVVDALLGTGAQGEPRPPLDRVIDELNAVPVARLAVDVPSGLDCDTGEPSRHTIRAKHTCTFAAPKIGLLKPEAARYVGELHVLDIGTPRKLLAEVL